jgi:hypothetical protein
MKKVRRFVFMKNPFEDKPEKFNQHQGLGILALEDVNKEERFVKSHAGTKMVGSSLTNDSDGELS